MKHTFCQVRVSSTITKVCEGQVCIKELCRQYSATLPSTKIQLSGDPVRNIRLSQDDKPGENTAQIQQSSAKSL